MYRFSINGEEWIVRFSPHVLLENDEKEAIVQSIFRIEKDLTMFTHGEAFLVLENNIGFIVFKVERIPSLILTVCHIIPGDRCYYQS